MKREVVQDFLNLPGIAGVALMDGRSRPYFYGVDQTLNFQQREALAQGIQQVVETTPIGFEFYEFQFAGHQVYIYKLDRSIILLVLTGSELVIADYEKVIKRLRIELEDDAANAIATFRLLAGNITLSNQNYWKRRSETTVNPNPAKLQPTPQTTEPASATVFNTLNNGAQRHPATSAPVSPIENPPTASPQTVSIPPPAPSPDPVSIKELLTALNHFSQFTTQYLGTTVVTNYWKSTRPEVEWLNSFQIDRSAQITFVDTGASNATQLLNLEQHQWVQSWIAAFVQRCSKVIRDFPSIIEQRALDDRQKMLLLTEKTN
jgi:hypothetical protein